MITRRWVPMLVVASVLLVVVTSGLLNGRSAEAQPAAQDPPPNGTTIPYAGQLSGESGQPAEDGAYDFTFALYDAESGGEPLWTETQEDVAVRAGSFTTLLGGVNLLPKQIAEIGQLWLEVGLRAPGVSDFSALTPRQRVTNTSQSSAAAPSCEHTHLYEWWEGSSSSYGLVVDNRYGTGDGVRGYSSGSAADYAGVYGVNFGSGPGVYGRSDGGGPGVAGYSSTNFGILASGDDGSAYDSEGDLLLAGNYGEIFASGNLLDLYSNHYVVVDLDNDNNSSNSCFNVLNGGDGILWSVCESARGVVAAGSQASSVQTADYGERLLYAVEATEVRVEDVGTAEISAGETTVSFDPIFAQTANLKGDYQVFVTAISQEPVWLYVSAKTADGFTVRGVTPDGQPADCSFDYRIVAQRLGHDDRRLELYEPAAVR